MDIDTTMGHDTSMVTQKSIISNLKCHIVTNTSVQLMSNKGKETAGLILRYSCFIK